jgi:hypothetical protein
MKRRSPKTKKLVLKKETLRPLTEKELAQAAGAFNHTRVGPSVCVCGPSIHIPCL